MKEQREGGVNEAGVRVQVNKSKGNFNGIMGSGFWSGVASQAQHGQQGRGFGQKWTWGRVEKVKS